MQQRSRYARVLLKVSGEALLGDQPFGIDEGVLERIASEIGQAINLGVKVGVVVGAGNIFRGVTLAKSVGSRVAADQMGMLATVMNAIALRQKLAEGGMNARLFSAVAMPSICETFNQIDAEAAYDAGEAVVFAGGTGNPFVTTDTGAALRAAEMGAEALFKGTKVDGVYSADPERDGNAVRFDRLTHEDVIEKGLKVMDTAAVALARDNGIPVIVFSILQPGAFVDILQGKGRATIVADA
jgi:uridylate kinase